MSDSAPTDEELLVLVKQALSGTLSRKAADISVAGRRIASLSIPDLIALRKDLEARIYQASRKSISSVVEFREPA